MSILSDIKAKSEFIKQEAYRLGFERCGITSTLPLADDEAFLRDWTNKNYHASMHYLTKNVEKRGNPACLVEGARSIVVVAQNYYPAKTQNTNKYRVAKYAYAEDYHVVIKDKLHILLQRATEAFGAAAGRCFTDSAPIFERALARRAGLGWIGKNGLLIIPQLGSYFFLGVLFINHDLMFDKPYTLSHCGACDRCLKACPSGALLEPHCMDARRCISYQTIENKGKIDRSVAQTITNQVYGCDVCQDVCPWNKKARPHCEPRFEPKADFIQLSDNDWHTMTKEHYDALFAQSAISRAGWTGLQRNINGLQD